MNPKHFHTPLSTRARCPVCHEAVYSRAGIHPQCAVRQSEPPRSSTKEPALIPAQPLDGVIDLAGADEPVEAPIAEKLAKDKRAPV